MRSPSPLTRLIILGSLVCAVALAGCGGAVREDRTVTWSSQGDTVGFQHGPEGVYVADKQGEGLEKIYQPTEDVIATSMPLWSPVDGRLIFTTARHPQGRPAERPRTIWEQVPEGNIHREGAAVYTCWLRNEPKDGAPVEPQALFEATCGHVGHVAANLAVRWHPRGDRVLFLNQTGGGQHGLFEFDLDTRRTRQVFPHSAEALIFDWTPDGSRLVCLLHNSSVDDPKSGIWIGQPDNRDWWHVAESEPMVPTELLSPIEQLRAARPGWTRDGARFAFTAFAEAKPSQDPRPFAIYQAALATRDVKLWAQTDQPVSDLHWSPDGTQIGVRLGGETPSLHMIGADGELSAPINARPVRRFAGWSAGGDQLAYVIPEAIPSDANRWAFVLSANPMARDVVLVTDGRGSASGDAVLSGMRVTFPHWSPRDDKLSVWVTFTPLYQSWLSRFFGWGLRAGDPAAILDARTGELRWMAVNAFEQAQVGHYFLLKRDYAESWEWYQKARQETRAATPATPARLFDRLFSSVDFSFFEYYCLTKLGRDAEAQAKLGEFKQNYLPRPHPSEKPADVAQQNLPAAQPNAGDFFGQWLAQVLTPDGLLIALLPDLYMAEVFLGLDAIEDGRAFFQNAMDTAESDIERLSKSIVLAQLLLIQGKYDEYATLTTSRVIPLLLQNWQPLAAGVVPGDAIDSAMSFFFGGLTMLPMYDPEFLATLPADRLAALVPLWEARIPEATDDVTRLGIDLFLHAAYTTLGKPAQRDEMSQRIEINPARAKLVGTDGIPGLLKTFREMLAWPMADVR